MGSLPNLHELGEAERKREQRRQYEFLVEQQRMRRDNMRNQHHLSLLERHRKQTAYNQFVVDSTGLGLRGVGTTRSLQAAAAGATSVAVIASASAAAVATAAITAGRDFYDDREFDNDTIVPSNRRNGGGGGGINRGATTIARSGGGCTASGDSHGNMKKHTTHRTTRTKAVFTGNFQITSAGKIGSSGAAIFGLTGHSTLLTTSTISDGPSTSMNIQRHQQLQQPQHQHQHHFHHHHHHPSCHSVTTRQRVLRARSSGATHNIWDDQMMEHLAACSPISTRSHRINPVSSHHVQAALTASRRRESMNSSIGATSVRHLITLNNRTCRNKVPLHVRKRVCKNFSFMALSHGLLCGILFPLLALQSSNSVWHHRELWLHIGPNIGSLLICLCFLIASGICLWSGRLIRRFGYSLPIGLNHGAMLIFLLCHLYPSIYTLLPGYILLGLTLSVGFVSKTALLVHFGSKMSCSQYEVAVPESQQDEHRLFCDRDQKVRRMARWFHVAQDLGIILGAFVAGLAISCASTDWNCIENVSADDLGETYATTTMKSVPTTTTTTTTTAASLFVANNTNTNNTKDPGKKRRFQASIILPSPQTPTALRRHHLWPYLSGYLDNFYSHNEHGDRICGAEMCPIWSHEYAARELRFAEAVAAEEAAAARAKATPRSNGNASKTPSIDIVTTPPSIYAHFIKSSRRPGATMLICTYILCAAMTVAISYATGKIQATFRNDRIRGMSDTLWFAGPFAYFIGTEQAYVLGDFMRAFVSCTMGLSMVSGALMAMGIMQCIVSCTVSMLLRHTKRILVILAGFFFHSCLLLTLSSWKPSSDDSALFYVIAASWGACNGMWETLLLNLVTLNHTNHVADVTAAVQALRFLGLSVTFGVHGYLCETTKIIALVVMLVVSVPPYAMLEIRLEAQRKATLNNL